MSDELPEGFVTASKQRILGLIDDGLLPDFPNPVELLDNLNKVARDNPKRIGSCEYIEGDTPACIVGVALSKYHGWDSNQLAYLGGQNIEDLYTWYIDRKGNFNINFDSDDIGRNIVDQRIILELINEIQSSQDSKKTWGEAIDKASEQLWMYYHDDVPFVEKIAMGIFHIDPEEIWK